MLNRAKVIEKIRKIKESDNEFLKVHKEYNDKRDRQFIEILEEIDNNYDILVQLVRTARFELLVQDIIRKSDEDKKEEDDELDGSQS